MKNVREEIDSKARYLDELRKLTERSLQAEYQSYDGVLHGCK